MPSRVKDLKVHFSLRLYRSVRHMGETVWQPLCGVSGTNSMTMTTVIKKVTCLNCRDALIKNAMRLGIKKQINAILREGVWYEPAE